MLSVSVEVQHFEVQNPTQAAEQNKLGLLPVWVSCVLFPACILERGVVVNADGNVGVGIPTTKLDAFETLSRDDRNLKYADGSVEWNAGHELFEVECEDMWFVHHGAEGGMDHLVNEGRKSGNLHPPFSS